jgi:hypothetical protein
MGDRGLRDRRQRVQVAERAEIVEKLVNLLVRRRYEGGGTWVVTTATDPVLLGANLAGVLVEPGSGKQVLVDSKNVVGRDLLLRVAEVLDRPGCESLVIRPSFIHDLPGTQFIICPRIRLQCACV